MVLIPGRKKSMIKLTPYQKMLKQKYTRLCSKKSDHIRLAIGNQGFRVLNGENGNWMRGMLATALSNLVTQEIKAYERNTLFIPSTKHVRDIKTKVKPLRCPFCGSKAVIEKKRWGNAAFWYSVRCGGALHVENPTQDCKSCQIQPRTNGYLNNLEGAIRDWNKR